MQKARKKSALLMIDTVRTRKKIDMSLSQFAEYYGVSVGAAQESEQGCSFPFSALPDPDSRQLTKL